MTRLLARLLWCAIHYAHSVVQTGSASLAQNTAVPYTTVQTRWFCVLISLVLPVLGLARPRPALARLLPPLCVLMDLAERIFWNVSVGRQVSTPNRCVNPSKRDATMERVYLVRLTAS
jgi:hypothetical protein